jgi:hypothetical protein
MRDRVKRMLGFVLVATIDGPPGSPRQTQIRARGCNRGLATTTGGHSPAFHSSRVAVLGHGDLGPKSLVDNGYLGASLDG